MIWMLRTVSVLALVAAALIFGLSVTLLLQDEEPPGDVEGLSIVERWREANDTCQSVEQDVPLVEQAKEFGSYLNPPPPPPPKPMFPVQTVAGQVSIPRNTPTMNPPAPTPKFRLHGISYCSLRPEKSMALISEPGGVGECRRWVKEGTQLGHFTVQEIRPGAIVCRSLSGELVREMAVEHEPARASLVRRRTTELAQASSPLPLAPQETDANTTGR